MEEFLTPAQLHRLGQIALQLKGLWAFHDAEVAADLGLSADQKQNLRVVEAETFASGPDGEPGGPGGGPDVHDLVDRFVGKLAPEQQQRWKAMTGEKFIETEPVGAHPPFDHPRGPGDGPPHFDRPHGPDRGPPPRPDGGPPPR